MPSTCRPIVVFAVCALLVCSSGARLSAQADRAKLTAAFAEVDRLVQDFMTQTRVPGAAWGIIVDGELAHTGVGGFRELAGNAPVSPDTVFRIASITKSFTAMSILKLRDEGKLSLDDPAERYVPELQRRLLAEAAWAYQGIPRIGRQHAYRQEALPKVVCDIAWKAQLRLTARFRRLGARGKAKPKVATAIARELTGFIWAIAREVSPAPR